MGMADAVEMDELCISRKHKLWLWTAVSRYTGQILTYCIADRTYKNAGYLRDSLPAAWQKRRIYSDRYGAYAAYLAPSRHIPSRHIPSDKGEGKTSVVEGVNNSLRHRCSLLVRRTSGPRATRNLALRVKFAVSAHNRAATKRWEKQQAKRNLAIAKTTQSKE